jgi:outer membrane protein assembly factor BamB
VGDLLVVGSCNGRIRALDKNTGKVRWEYDITKDGDQRQFHGDPLITDELVIIGTDGSMGHVYAFERSTGQVRWKYRVNERGVASDIVRLGDSIYAVTLGNELLSLDVKTGKPNWTFHGGYSGQDCLPCSSPAAVKDRIYFGGVDGFAYALNTQSGKLVWQRDLGAKVTTSAAIHGGDLYLGTAKRHLYRLNADSGDVLGDMETQAQPIGRLVLADNSLLAFLGDEIFASFDLDLKNLRWSAEASKQWTSARPYLWHDFVLTGNRRELIAFRSSDGSRQWSHNFPETIRGIGTSPEVLYIGTLNGAVFAYCPKTWDREAACNKGN